MLRLQGRLCVVVGGGATACRRAKSLQDSGARVRMISPVIQKDFVDQEIQIFKRKYQSGDLSDAFLVVIATDDQAVNEQIHRDAKSIGALVNRVDDPSTGDLTIPAHEYLGPITLAVHTGGISAAAAVTIRHELIAALDPDWQKLLELVAPFRVKIQQRFLNAKIRQARLVRLTDAEAMKILKNQGAEQLLSHLQKLLTEPETELSNEQVGDQEPKISEL